MQCDCRGWGERLKRKLVSFRGGLWGQWGAYVTTFMLPSPSQKQQQRKPKTASRASEMAQQITALAAKATTEVHPWDPYGGRETTPANCPLMVTCVLGHTQPTPTPPEEHPSLEDYARNLAPANLHPP